MPAPTVTASQFRLRGPRAPSLDHPATAIVILSAWCGLLFFYGLGVGELWRTENLRAIIAAEFLRSGNWVVPTLYGEPLFTKPPGMYAAIAAVSWPLGHVTEFTARLPSAIAASATVFFFWWTFRRALSARAGLIAGLLLPMSLMWLDKATSAEIDMLQVFWVSAAILSALRAIEADETAEAVLAQGSYSGVPASESTGGWWWLVSLLCVAGGVLTKWTAPAFFYGTLLPLLWWRGQLRLLWRRHHLLSAAAGATLCCAWIAAAVAMSGWDSFYDTVSREALQRLSPSHHQEARVQMSTQHREQPHLVVQALAHPFIILGASLPGSAAALLTLRRGFGNRWQGRARLLLEAAHCWVWPNLLFWSIVPEHAPRHSFPLVPGFVALAVFAWIDWWPSASATNARQPRRRFTAAHVFAGLLVIWLVVKIGYVHVVVPGRNTGREPRAKGEWLAHAIPPGETLYLFRLKDEGIMFYYGRAVHRLAGLDALPSSPGPLYCILDDAEWRQWPAKLRADELLRMNDEQGAPIVLTRIYAAD
jgi:4-amino-4-deoxy-L-arabinose transferase-like glycosyltransferase